MSVPDIANVFSVPGRLSHSPTDLSTAYPHGGTAIGTVAKVTPYPRDPSFPVRAVEWGNAVIDVIEGGPDWTISALLREVLDADALAAIFPCYTTGRSGGPLLEMNVGTDAQRAGVTIPGLVVVFTPDSPDHHPFLVIRRAVPAVQATAELALRGNDELAWPVVWYATPDSNKKVISYGLRRDITL